MLKLVRGVRGPNPLILKFLLNPFQAKYIYYANGAVSSGESATTETRRIVVMHDEMRGP